MFLFYRYIYCFWWPLSLGKFIPVARSSSSYFILLISMPTFRDLVTAVVYSYITCEFHYVMALAFQHLEVLCYNGLNLQRFVYRKNVNRHFSRNFDIFAIKMTYLNAVLSFLLSSCFSV